MLFPTLVYLMTTGEIVAEYENIINIYMYTYISTYSWHLFLKVILQNTVQFISLQEVWRLMPLLNVVPYDLILTSKASNNLCGIKGNCPPNNLKRKVHHLELFV